MMEEQNKAIQSFVESSEGVGLIGKRKSDDNSDTVENDQSSKRKRLIDETPTEIRLEQLKKVSPWIPQFTPEAKDSSVPEPPKRPASPFSGQPLRSKDLISISLTKETSSTGTDSTTRYICPVSRLVTEAKRIYNIHNTFFFSSLF